MGDQGGGLYLEPLVYDVVNGPGTAREVDALIRASGSRPGSVWLEPACGTGRYLHRLRRRGYPVRGYDPEPAMLDHAGRRLARLGRDHRLVRAEFTTPAAALADLGPVDVAFCPVNSLRHLHRDQDVLAHLEQIAGLLAPGGVYLVGLDLHHDQRQVEEDVWQAARGRLEVTQVVQYLPPGPGSRREQVIVEVVVRRPRGVQHHSFTYDLRTYTESQWGSLVDRSALRRLRVCNASGRPLDAVAAGSARLPYQIEVLERR
jgi:SAM-dependent methyltransferase